MAGIGYNAWKIKNYGQRIKRNEQETLLDNEALLNINPINDDDMDLSVEGILAIAAQCGPNCRFIFQKLLEGYEMKEIAELLDISHENARKQKSDCAKKLRTRL